MSELTWYSRTAILGGSLVLVVQAVTQRGVGVVTVLAVLAVSLGLVAFVWGLVADASGPRKQVDRRTQPVQVEVADDQPAHGAVVPEAKASGQEALLVEKPVATTPAPTQNLSASVSDRVRTFRVDAADPAASLDCPACRREIGAGHIAAVCPVCGRTHHASCWIDADFRCSVEGCSGVGSLERPERGARPERGPSKP